MIDIHSHILPFLDDGATNPDEALEMARMAVEEGVAVLFATPHHRNGVYTNEADVVGKAVGEFRLLLSRNGIPLEIAEGQEIRFYETLLDDLDKGELLPLNRSRYYLIELPSGYVPSGVQDLIHELRVIRKIPIIAHPERNAELARNPEMLTRLIESGAICQLTTHSLAGLFGDKIRALSLDWCRRGLVHLLASDAHRPRGRAFSWGKCLDVLSDEFGDELAERYLANARSVYADEEPAFAEISAQPRKKRLWFFWRK